VLATKIVQFLAVILTALALVPSGAHFFALPNKIDLTQEHYFIAQNIYRGWALFGIVLFPALAVDLALAIMLRRQPAPSGGLWVDERTRILRVLEANRWHRQRAAAALGISRVTLWRRMERHGIRDPLGSPVRETA